MCETHNKQKGRYTLEDFRINLRLKEFFGRGDSLTLKHLLAYLKEQGDIKSYGQNIIATEMDDRIEIDTPTGRSAHALYKCPATGWLYFYATLPVEVLNSDDDEEKKIGLQPRHPIFDKVFELYRHFQGHPVLQPSIGRLDRQRILLFDGQHKAAALLWGGRRSFECKIYLNPDLRLLNETNISAHDKFSQTRFYASIMVVKLGTEFGNDFQAYKDLEDGLPKSEAGFLQFLERDPKQAMTTADRNKRFRSYLYNSILQHTDNRFSKYVSTGNRGTDERPITIDLLTKSILAGFLYSEPVEDNMATDAYKRDTEIENVVALMNNLHDLALGQWNPKAGRNDSGQRRLVRLFTSKGMMAWCELLRDAVCGKLDLQDNEDRVRPLYRDICGADMEKVKKVVERLVNWKMWNAPPDADIDQGLSGNKSAVKDWFRNKGLTTGYLMGASE